MQPLQVYKLSSFERRNSIFGFRIIVEKISHQHRQSLSQIDFGGVFGMHQPAPLTSAFALADTARLEGLAFYFRDDYDGLRPCRHNSARGARLLLKR